MRQHWQRAKTTTTKYGTPGVERLQFFQSLWLIVDVGHIKYQLAMDIRISVHSNIYNNMFNLNSPFVRLGNRSTEFAFVSSLNGDHKMMYTEAHQTFYQWTCLRCHRQSNTRTHTYENILYVYIYRFLRSALQPPPPHPLVGEFFWFWSSFFLSLSHSLSSRSLFSLSFRISPE